MFKSILTECDKFINIDNIYVNIDQKNTHHNAFEYEKIKGTSLFDRSRVKGTHSFFDYSLAIKQLKTLGNLNQKIVLDIGCGDGRFAYWFLENTEAKVVCVDSCLESLKKLKNNIGYENYHDRVLIIQSDILSIPEFKILFDVVWSFETLYYLDDFFEEGVESISRIIKKGGILMNTERNYYGGLIHSLINGSIDNFTQAIQTNKIKDYWGDDINPRSLLVSDRYMSSVLKKNNFLLKEKNRLPIFTTLISHLLSCGKIEFKELQDKSIDLVEVFYKLSIPESMSRATIYSSIKSKD
jgi:SAM-dependent methyltransferase